MVDMVETRKNRKGGEYRIKVAILAILPYY